MVWWAWNYTTWVTNELDPDSVVVRLLLIGIMLASLLMAVAIPEAFGEHALLFAASYVAIQVGRHTFLTFASAGRAARSSESAQAGSSTWFVAAGVLWIAGGFADGPARTALWLAALAIDYTAPLVPLLGPRAAAALDHTTWEVETAHFAERFQLFVIIALGETIVITGATTARARARRSPGSPHSALAFLGTAALWWLYFGYVARIAQRRLELAPERTASGARRLHVSARWNRRRHRSLAAVGDELVIAHPTEELPGRRAAVGRLRAGALPARARAVRLRMAGR